uniref:Uncharacterized protein n=1 Tax=Tanacetum cinerariifolium TaxID=118510 RepID=A0A699HQ57_TANCI|nr:hypothetical protein [Tanacetum cinerariifolium]
MCGIILPKILGCSGLDNKEGEGTGFYLKRPTYDHLRVFGCLGLVSNPSRTADKFNPRGVPCVFLGYPSSQKGYKFYNLTTKSTFVSRDVVFYEDVFPFAADSINNFLTPLPITFPYQSKSTIDCDEFIFDTPHVIVNTITSALPIPSTESQSNKNNPPIPNTPSVTQTTNVPSRKSTRAKTLLPKLNDVVLHHTPRAKKQVVVSISSTKVEYRAMALICCEVTWLVSLFKDLGITNLKPVDLHCDNQVCLYIAANPVFHARTKHIEVDCHFVRDQLKSGKINPSYVNTKEQLADVFTKVITMEQHNKLLSKLGVVKPTNSQLEGECEIGIMAIMIGSLDQGNPLYLHANDSNCASICYVKLTGVDNCRIWASAMKLALQIKHKMGFITGTCVRTDYVASAPLLEQWDMCNVVVLNWILSSLSQEVYLGHVFSNNAATVWNELKDTYDRIDGSIVFNLLQKTNSFKQGGLPVSEYYHKLNSLWRENEILTKLLDYTCNARLEVANYDKMLKLMQFLMGLDDIYQPIRSSILTREVLPEAKDVFLIISKESHRGIPSSSGVYDNLLCKNCGLKGHTIDRCFKLVGYPPSFKRNPNLKPNTNGNFKSNNGDFRKGSSNNSKTKTSDNVSFTNEQVMKLMSLLNDKGSAGQSNMAEANQHMTNSIKDMVNLVDVSDLKLTVGHPNGTLTKITHVGNLKLNNDVMLFDVLVILEYTGRVLGTGSEFGGLYLFDKEYNESTIANNSPCEVCHKAKQTRDSFPLSENKSTVFGQLMHPDVWGPYKVISTEGFRYFLTISDDYSRLHSSVLNGKSPFSLVYNKEPNLSHLRSFGYLCYVALIKGSDKFSKKSEKCVLIGPNDDEEGSSCRDGSIHKLGPSHSLDQPKVDEQIPTSCSGSDLQGSGSDGLVTATPIDENTSFEGNVGFNDQVPVFQNIFQNQTEEVNLRKSSRTTKLPAKFNKYVLDNKVKYGLNRYANHTHLDSQSRSFISNINKTLEPFLFEEASKDPNWISAMNDEMNALYENDTWYLVDLPFGRKPIGSKWVFKIKYKSDGEVDRFKARVVAKGFGQKEGLDYEETFNHVVKMGTVRCLLSLAVQNEWDIYQTDINNAFLYGDLIEEVYMLLPLGFFDPSDKRVLSGYCVFVNGCLVSWKSKKQVTLSKSMAAATCEIMWIVKIMSDLNIKNLLRAELYCDNKAAMQIAANPVMHE